MARNISNNGLRFTAAWERFSPRAYFATKYEEQIRLYTWGYGHTGRNPPTYAIGQDEALLLLETDMAKAVDFADKNAHPSLNQAQFDAICDLCFNVGLGVIAKDNVLGDFDDAVRDGNIERIRAILPTFRNQAGKPMLGIYRRAMARLALFDGMSAEDAEQAGRSIKSL